MTIPRRVLVCGGRRYYDKVAVFTALDELHAADPIRYIGQGGAQGADKLAKQWAALNFIPCREYTADWKLHGPKAGPLRNHLMLMSFKPHLVLAFPGGRGTANMVMLARRFGVPVIERA